MSDRPYYAVIGRIPYDDEDTCYCFQIESLKAAVRAFADAICTDRGLTEKDRDFYIRDIGGDLGVYINHVLRSESPIDCA